MKAVFEFSEDALLVILEGAKERGLSPEDFIMEAVIKADPQQSTSTIEVVCVEAVRAAVKLAPGTEFIIDDVVPNFREQLNVRDRQALGRMFRVEIEAGEVATFTRRNTRNQAMYRRKGSRV
jgi:hypothetical protein